MAEKRNKATAKKENLESLGLEMGNKPPQALDVEEAVLGAMLIEPSCVDLALEELKPDCFYDPKHKMIFEAMSSLVTEHTAVDIITVTAKLKEKGNLEEVGGAVVLASLSDRVGTAAHIEYYVKILKQKTIQRDLISASHEILKDAFDDSIKVDELIDKAQTKVYEAIQSNVRKEIEDIGAVINRAMGDIQEQQGNTGVTGVPSGYPSIDRVTMGWQKSDLVILAARPSVGKTAFALNIARNAAVDHHMPVAVFSLEMSSIQLAKRLMTSESGLSADKIKGGIKLEPYEWEQLEYKLKDLSVAPLYIDDTPGIQLMEFRTKAKNLVKNKGVRLIIVDYLQLMQGPTELRGMREQEVAAISRTLKATAKELEIPIIALSQLSRASVQRTGGNGKPQLSDLRESGSIEQDADIVCFIHRPEYYHIYEDDKGNDLRGMAQFIIAKHRNGAVGDVLLKFRSEFARFEDPGESEYVPMPGETMPRISSALNGEEPPMAESPFGPSEPLPF